MKRGASVTKYTAKYLIHGMLATLHYFFSRVFCEPTCELSMKKSKL